MLNCRNLRALFACTQTLTAKPLFCPERVRACAPRSNWHDSRRLGSGSYGSVYKAPVLSDHGALHVDVAFPGG